jgi:ribonuclease P protein component
MRVGIVVPKFGHTSVERNLLKRRLRELARHLVLPQHGRCDVIVWAMPSAYRQNFSQLEVTLKSVLDRMDECHAAVT